MRKRWWTRWFGPDPQAESPGTFVMDAVWNRTEELRPDRLGPDETVVQDPERPSRTLGKF